MADRVSFSSLELSLDEIAIHHETVQAGLFEYFAGKSKSLLERYDGSMRSEARSIALAELDSTSCLSVLSSLEASIRIDYLSRVYDRWRDPLSKAMKSLHQEKGNRARLEDELLVLWRDYTDIHKPLLGNLASAFKYRHWLAHGRYWAPKFGRKYDFQIIYEIAQLVIEGIEDHNAAYDDGRVTRR